MAGIAEVRQAIVSVISATLYPNGPLYGPSIIPGAGPIMVVPAWPKSADLGREPLAPWLQGGTDGAVIAVADFGAPRSTTRFTPRTQVASIPEPTLAWTVAGNAATLGGTADIGQNVGLIIDGKTHAVHSTVSGDTIASVLSGLSSVLPSGYTGSISGATLIVVGASTLIGRVGTIASTIKAVAQQRQDFMISIWAGSEALRSEIVNAIKPTLDFAKWLNLSDGSRATIASGREVTVPATSKLGISESRILYSIEYSTVIKSTAPIAIVAQAQIPAPSGAIVRTTEA